MCVLGGGARGGVHTFTQMHPQIKMCTFKCAHMDAHTGTHNSPVRDGRVACDSG